MDNDQRRDILLGNLKGMLNLRYTLHGLSRHASDPDANPEHWEGWDRIEAIDKMEVDTLREAIKFVEAQPVKKLIITAYN